MFDLVPPHQHWRDSNKQPDARLFLCQQHAVIQLVEVDAPPPRRISSVIDSSSAASSSSSSSSSSSCDDEQDDDDDDDVCTSYCSSDDCAPEQQQQQHPAPTTLTASDSDAFSRRMKRILLWRAHSETPSTDSLKRKLQEIDEPLQDDDNASQSSKRSRSSGSARSISSEELSMHPCPACDAGFPTLQSLRLHGQRGGSEACCVAVEYALEQ